MNAVLKILLATWLAAVATSARGDDHTFSDLAACKPGTVDGTQVFENTWVSGECFGKPKIATRITDFTLEAVCWVIGKRCLAKGDLNPFQLRHYERMRDFAKPPFPTKRCFQGDGQTWQLEMIASDKVPCNPAANGARAYDYIMNQGCVLYGTLTVGCIDLPLKLQRNVQY